MHTVLRKSRIRSADSHQVDRSRLCQSGNWLRNWDSSRHLNVSTVANRFGLKPKLKIKVLAELPI